ncbi:MAG: hypothetical protein IT487_01730 [Chromatiaceae bacterium]|nr:hypothetical protein [Chromatiaceae bacterium]
MNTKTLSTQRRLQVAILGYGLLFLSPQLHGAGTLVLLAGLAVCLGFILLALHSSVPGTARPSRQEHQERPRLFTRMRLVTPLPQV